MEFDRLIERFDACAARLRHVHFEQQDALDVLDRWDTPDTTFFIDPPCPATTASWFGPNQRRKNVYGHDMHDDDPTKHSSPDPSTFKATWSYPDATTTSTTMLAEWDGSNSVTSATWSG